MKLLSVDNYVDFECIAGDCPISCCGGNWGIPIDDDSYSYYMSVEGEFGERLRNGIIRMNDTNMFRLDDKTKDCVFLNENKLCSIYRSLGSDAMCLTCKTYPRAMYQVGDIMFCFLANSCPEVNRMIFQKKEPLRTLFDDSDDDMEESNDFDHNRFDNALRAFNAGLHIIQNRDITLGDRIFLILFYVERFQELMKNNSDASDLTGIFSNPSIYEMFLENRVKDADDFSDRIHVFMMVYRILMADSYDHPIWVRCSELADDIVHKGVADTDALSRAFLSVEKDKSIQIELEQLMSYRFFAMFMRGLDHDDYLDRLAYEIVKYAALVTYMALTETIHGHMCSQEDRILFYSLCSRIDHTSKQKDKLIDELRREGYYTMEKLLKLII